jgi:hypothetical protein
MSTTEEKLETFINGLNVLANLPIAKLAENKELVQSIKDIVSSHNMGSLLYDLSNDRYLEKLEKMRDRPASQFEPESQEFMHLYSNYQTAGFNVFRDTAKARMTSLLHVKDARAFNSRKHRNPFAHKSIASLDATQKFATALNSIYSDRGIQINSRNDPTRIGSYIDYSPYTWNVHYYLSINTLGETIDRPIFIATREMPDIVFQDHALSQAIEKELKRQKFNALMRKGLRYTALSPRGSLMVPIEENGTIRFNMFNDTQFTYAATQHYGRIDFHDTMTGVNQVFCLGHLLQNEVSAHFVCPGFEPIYAIGKNRLYQLKDAAEAVNIYLYTIKVLCIRAQVIIAKWGGKGQTDGKLARMRKVIDDINSKLSLSEAVKIPEDAELDILTNNINPGFADVAPVVKDYQGMMSGLASDFYYGSQTAYAANTFNLQVSFQNIRSQFQEEQLEPRYRYAVNCLLQRDRRFRAYEKYVDDFDVRFKPLYEPTDKEKAETDSLRIDNLIKMRAYPEMVSIFKEEGLLRDEYEFNFAEAAPPRPTETTLT